MAENALETLAFPPLLTAEVTQPGQNRLRFPNLEKPRTAGLCDRAGVACDVGSLSCSIIERPFFLEKGPEIHVGIAFPEPEIMRREGNPFCHKRATRRFIALEVNIPALCPKAAYRPYSVLKALLRPLTI